MSFAKVYSAQNSFPKVHIVNIEVDLSRGLHSFSLVGLPGKATGEARDRISAAIKNSGFTSPKQKNQKIVVSLAPADIKKDGPHFDLGIAIAYLKASGDVSFDSQDKLFLGEVSLDGEVKEIRGAIGMVIEAKKAGFKNIFLPMKNSVEATQVDGISIYGVCKLIDLTNHLQGKQPILRQKHLPNAGSGKIGTGSAEHEDQTAVDFSDIHGQETAKRALEIAAAGRHNIMLYGPPGTGKTMLIKAFMNILPELNYKEMLQVTAIHSAAGTLSCPFISHPPIRSPHHTSSTSSIIGGSSTLKPGEMTLAHKGVLFLDEFPEFDRRTIESLRQPLEEKIIRISRVGGSAVFPADFILAATMNPCPCGNYGSKNKACVCGIPEIRAYRKKISDPIADRIDLWVKVDNQNIAEVTEQKLIRSTSAPHGCNTQTISERVKEARLVQQKRFANRSSYDYDIETNANISVRYIKDQIILSKENKKMLDAAANRLSLSIRSYYRIIKVARTIADLEKTVEIEKDHLLEALQYRPKLEE